MEQKYEEPESVKSQKNAKTHGSTEYTLTLSLPTLIAIVVAVIGIYSYLNNEFSAIKTAIHHLDLKYEARMTKTETQMEERNNTTNK